MSAKLLILGGTTEARALANAVAQRGIPATFSYAGRVERPREQAIPTRVGGFGGAQGLAQYLRDHQITHLIDATHPFAAQMSVNAVQAAAETGVPLAALVRPPWTADKPDNWQNVPDMAGAVAALAGPARRVMLALGRLHLAEFAGQPQHHYLLRLVDAPEGPPPLPDHTVTVERGPFTVENDLALLRDHRIDLIVCKNAGGAGSEAKLHAARQLGLPVIMVDRPHIPPRTEIATVEGIFDWLDHSTDRGV